MDYTLMKLDFVVLILLMISNTLDMFKVGQKVICIDDDSGKKMFIKRGKTYIITSLHNHRDFIIVDSLHSIPYYKSRFKVLNQNILNDF